MSSMAPEIEHKPFIAGFTLVELMIVTAIIGILIAVAVPAFKKHVMNIKTPEFTIGQSVIVVGGFYKGCRGKTINKQPYGEYRVSLESCPNTNPDGKPADIPRKYLKSAVTGSGGSGSFE